MGTVGTTKLGTLVKEYDELIVEDYQRVYVWEDRNIKSFWEDLTELADNPHDRPHFFGTLILETKPESTTAKVVDGQQRLTTAVIVVAALRDAALNLSSAKLPSEGGHLPVDVDIEAWKFLIPGTDTSKSRFKPNRLLRKMMMTSVIAAPSVDRPSVPWGKKLEQYEKPTAITKPFRKAVRYVAELVALELEPYGSDIEKLRRIDLLLNTILERFTVLAVPTGSIDESLDIFLTLNSRGQDLKASDLVRGEILKSLSANTKSEAEIQDIHKKNLREWAVIGEQVQDHEAFLRHYLVAQSDSQITKKMVLREVERILHPEQSDGLSESSRAFEFWNSLRAAAKIYAQVLNPSFKTTTDRYLRVLNELIVSHRVLFLNVLLVEPSEKDLEEIARLAMVLGYRWMLFGMNAQILENFFRDSGRTYFKNKDAFELIQTLKHKVSEVPAIPASKWAEGQDSGVFTKATLFLHEAHEFTKVGDEEMRMKDFHLEHVAPQAPTDWWVEETGIAESLSELDEDDWSNFVSSAGNLSLLEPKLNIPASNLPMRTADECHPTNRRQWKQKKCFYQKSKMQMNADICDAARWSKETIVDRTLWVAELFEFHFSVKKQEGTSPTFAAWQNSEG